MATPLSNCKRTGQVRPDGPVRVVDVRTVTLRMLREGIGEALRDAMSASSVEEFCTSIGLASPNPPEDIAFSSKRAYVVRRLTGKAEAELLRIALLVLDECDPAVQSAADLAHLVAQLNATGVPGELKNLIFAADGPKPEIVLSDAINNNLVVVKNDQFCLVYDRPLGDGALTWRQLGDWWAHREGLTDRPQTEIWYSLLERLDRSLGANDAERRVLHTYAQRYPRLGPDIPALIPQVYLHYDPYSHARHAPGIPPLARQRMDFLMLLPNRVRIVIECDGKQHYAEDDGRASPRKYAEMVAEDRALRLRGYDVYRFGGHELGEGSESRIAAFFDALHARHSKTQLPG